MYFVAYFWVRWSQTRSSVLFQVAAEELRNANAGTDALAASDLNDLPHTNDAAVLHVIKERHTNGKIYTWVAAGANCPELEKSMTHAVGLPPTGSLPPEHYCYRPQTP